MQTLPPFTSALKRATDALSLNAKRRPLSCGVDSWYPYYAGFSREFASRVIAASPLQRESIVLDPWNGSGTTTYVANNRGFQASGYDTNPVAILVASAKLANPDDALHVLGLARRIATQAVNSSADHEPDSLTGWLAEKTIREYRTFEKSIVADLATSVGGRTADALAGGFPPLASFLILALIRAARKIAHIRTTTNPTWIVKDPELTQTQGGLGALWVKNVEEMACDLLAGRNLHSAFSRVSIGNATALPTPDSSVDFVLTSPPYCTRIDYVVSSSFELAALGLCTGTDAFDSLRRGNMGTPLVRSTVVHNPRKTWPPSIREVLDRIASHNSKASSSYYYKTYWQYFDDCERSLKEMYRALGRRSAAVFVVQSSYYKEILVDLPKLYVALGQAIGFECQILAHTAVRKNLAQINSKSRIHRQVTSHYEAVIVLEKVSD